MTTKYRVESSTLPVINKTFDTEGEARDYMIVQFRLYPVLDWVRFVAIREEGLAIKRSDAMSIPNKIAAD
jgi:hypothetical protein